ncbi:DUF6273 domain-containing protein [Slackia heliotrinireducens]|uniref:DUF6273 domain-containing protein n=1 Tax=Slackia heliotrinireducens TaxID=84110 RepID=UPI0033147F1C
MRAPTTWGVALLTCVLAAGMVGCAADSSTGTGDNSSLLITTQQQAEVQEFETVTFGSYAQGGESASPEPIEWYVLAEDGDKTLLVSKYVLDAVPFNQGNTGQLWSNDNTRATVDVEWADSSIRAWLNGEFYNAAFSADEQAQIVATDLSTAKNAVPPAAGEELSYQDSRAGTDTTDNVFLLSRIEAMDLFNNDAARAAAPTEYAIAKGVYTGVESDASGAIDEEASGNAPYWLRSEGYYAGYASVVLDSGYVNGDGFRQDGEVKDGNADHGTELTSDYGGNFGVRPCIWVETAALS